MRVLLPDVNAGAYGTGTMLRPTDARKQELDVRLADLPNALSAVPQGSWPYGRVVAVEETPIETKADRPAVRRNVEATDSDIERSRHRGRRVDGPERQPAAVSWPASRQGCLIPPFSIFALVG